MLDHSELDEARLRQLAERLEQLEAELELELSRTADDAAPVDVAAPIGRLSRMDAIQQQKMSLAAREQQRLRLSRVRMARDAMAKGEYGVCRVCDEDIALPRLEVRPESLVCMACQEKRESGSN